MDRSFEAVCLDCATVALGAAADRLSTRSPLPRSASLDACRELAINLIETGQSTCPVHRPTLVQAAS